MLINDGVGFWGGGLKQSKVVNGIKPLNKHIHIFLPSFFLRCGFREKRSGRKFGSIDRRLHAKGGKNWPILASPLTLHTASATRSLRRKTHLNCRNAFLLQSQRKQNFFFRLFSEICLFFDRRNENRARKKVHFCYRYSFVPHLENVGKKKEEAV